MNSQHGDAFTFRATRELRRIEPGFIPAEPHFHGDRNLHRADGGADEIRCEIEIAHQGRTSRAASDALCGTAHVDVDHGSASGFRKPRRFRHRLGRAAGNLHDMRRNPLPGCADRGFAISADVELRVQHFRNSQRRAKAHGEPTHAEIGDTRHGGKKRPARQAQRADDQIVAQVA